MSPSNHYPEYRTASKLWKEDRNSPRIGLSQALDNLWHPQTHKDPPLSKVLLAVRNGWPDAVAAELMPYFRWWDDQLFSLLWSTWVPVPTSCKPSCWTCYMTPTLVWSGWKHLQDHMDGGWVSIRPWSILCKFVTPVNKLAVSQERHCYIHWNFQQGHGKESM